MTSKLFNNKRILITGATGFVGANLAHRLVNIGAKPHIILRKESSKLRIKSIESKMHLHYCDLTENKKLQALIKDVNPEIIFHTAAYGGHISQNDVAKILQVNQTGTMNLINACDNIDYDSFINSGSSSEYGIKNKSMKEDDVLEPITDYGITKSAATMYCQEVACKTGKSIATLRLFSPYGKYDDSSRLVAYAISTCLKGNTIKLSSPDSVRDFIFIEDVIDAYLLAAKNPVKIKGEIFNVGSGKQYSICEVVNKIIKFTNSSIKPSWGSISNPRFEPSVWQADISKIRKYLSWKPMYSIEEGLKKTIESFQKGN